MRMTRQYREVRVRLEKPLCWPSNFGWNSPLVCYSVKDVG